MWLCCYRLPSPLTPAKRSREARLGGASQAGSSLASPSQRLKTEPTSDNGSAAVTGAAAAAKAAAGPMPGDDLPPVIAPPGRCALLSSHCFMCCTAHGVVHTHMHAAISRWCDSRLSSSYVSWVFACQKVCVQLYYVGPFTHLPKPCCCLPAAVQVVCMRAQLCVLGSQGGIATLHHGSHWFFLRHCMHADVGSCCLVADHALSR